MRALLAFALAFSAVACRYPNADEHFGLVQDADGDGYTSDVDCDDADEDVNPGADELCNEADDDCDQDVDEDAVDPASFWVDADDDGFGDDDVATAEGCVAPEGYAPVGGDCNDDDKDIHPTALDISDDTIDQDCNGFDTVACAVDADHDGFGTDDLTTVFAADGSCDTEQGESDNAQDCLDDDEASHPGGQEVPGDGIDQDCSGSDAPPCWHDDDGDGFGDTLAPLVVATCDGDGQVENDDDCDDGDGTIAPGAPELCDGQVNACGGSLPANETDPDGDHFVACVLDGGGWDGGGGVTGGNDCETTDGTVFPGAPELCDGQVNACGQALPANEANTDGDAFAACTLDSGGWDGPGTVTGSNDCKDNDATVFPGATELCDGQDNNCDLALTDLEDDDDNDNYIECLVDVGGWDGVDGDPLDGFDCNDGNGQTHPGAAELCDGFDNNCAVGITDEGGRASFLPDGGGAWVDVTALLAPASVRGAYMAAATGTLWLCDGSWYASISVPTTLSTFTVRSRNGRATTTLSGAAPTVPATPVGRVITTTGTGTGSLTVQGLTLKTGNGNGLSGGAIVFAGTPTAAVVQDCIITGNTVGAQGGGIYLSGGALTVSNTEITGNTAGAGGGFYQAFGATTFSDVVVDGNHATANGGGGIAIANGTFAATGTLSDSHCEVTNNTVTGDGGAVLMDDNASKASATFTRCTIDGNDAVDEGGAFACREECSLTVTDTFVTNNAGDKSGAVDFDNGDSQFSCVATTNNLGAVKDNTATSTNTGTNPRLSGGVLIGADGATVSSSHCDWGTGADDNLFTGTGGTVNVPSDVGGDNFRDGSYSANASFTCAFDGCTTTP